jgi:hypothetical protein
MQAQFSNAVIRIEGNFPNPVLDANFAKKAEPGAGNFKEICRQCLFMQKLISPCLC